MLPSTTLGVLLISRTGRSASKISNNSKGRQNDCKKPTFRKEVNTIRVSSKVSCRPAVRLNSSLRTKQRLSKARSPTALRSRRPQSQLPAQTINGGNQHHTSGYRKAAIYLVLAGQDPRRIMNPSNSYWQTQSCKWNVRSIKLQNRG